MKRVLLCIWIVLLLGVCACPGFGQDRKIEELETRIALLERRILQLEKDLEELSDTVFKQRETILDLRPLDSSLTTSEQAAPAGEPWKDRQNWRRLKPGMTKQDVIRILGQPEKIDRYRGWEIWKYDYPGGGRVSIDDNDGVTVWSEP